MLRGACQWSAQIRPDTGAELLQALLTMTHPFSACTNMGHVEWAARGVTLWQMERGSAGTWVASTLQMPPPTPLQQVAS